MNLELLRFDARKQCAFFLQAHQDSFKNKSLHAVMAALFFTTVLGLPILTITEVVELEDVFFYSIEGGAFGGLAATAIHYCYHNAKLHRATTITKLALAVVSLITDRMTDSNQAVLELAFKKILEGLNNSEWQLLLKELYHHKLEQLENNPYLIALQPNLRAMIQEIKRVYPKVTYHYELPRESETVMSLRHLTLSLLLVAFLTLIGHALLPSMYTTSLHSEIVVFSPLDLLATASGLACIATVTYYNHIQVRDNSDRSSVSTLYVLAAAHFKQTTRESHKKVCLLPRIQKALSLRDYLELLERIEFEYDQEKLSDPQVMELLSFFFVQSPKRLLEALSLGRDRLGRETKAIASRFASDTLLIWLSEKKNYCT